MPEQQQVADEEVDVYRRTVAQVVADRERWERERRPVERLRHLVSHVDALIEACEQTHLDGVKRMTPPLRVAAGALDLAARSGPGSAAIGEGLVALHRVLTRPDARIVDLMDAAWLIQEAAFDLLAPHRTLLPDDVEDVEGAWAA